MEDQSPLCTVVHCTTVVVHRHQCTSRLHKTEVR